jgi:tetraacyldisaccharide 4'-kinase
MREPGFWYRGSSLLSAILLPVASVYGAITARRMARGGERVGVPVICIGNYHLGGAGKTPTTLAVARLLQDMGETPFVVSRGYGGELPGPLRVEASHRAAEVGDEPLMMSQHIPVIVSRDRVSGGRLAVSAGASVILLDDGFQNPALEKDASVIVVDGQRAIGNGKVFPAGPLRAPLTLQIARTDAMIVIGEGRSTDHLTQSVAARGALITRGFFKPSAEALVGLSGKAVLAFAGIGDPSRFFMTLRASGVNVVREKSFADHHRFTAADVGQLIDEAAMAALTLVTTEKDMARLASDPALASFANGIVPFAVTLTIENEAGLRSFLQERLTCARAP